MDKKKKYEKLDNFIRIRNRRSYRDMMREKLIMILGLLPCFFMMASSNNYLQVIGMILGFTLMVFTVIYDV